MPWCTMTRRGCARLGLTSRPESKPSFRRALQKDPARRYQSAAEMVNDLSAALTALEAPPGHVGLRAVYAIPAAVLVLLAAGISVWFYQRSEKRHWAREQAIPEIARLESQTNRVAAFRLLQEAQKYLPGDPQLAQIAERSLARGFRAIYARGSCRGNQGLPVAGRPMVSAGHDSSRPCQDSERLSALAGFESRRGRVRRRS